MGIFELIIVVVAIGAGSSIVNSIFSSMKPKIREKDLERIKEEIKRELIGDGSMQSITDARETSRRLEHLESQATLQERQIEDLTEENNFLKRLIDK